MINDTKLFRAGFLFSFFLFFLTIGEVFGDITRLVRSVGTIAVKSLKQKMINDTTAFFEEEVEILIDHKIHIWASSVTIDRDKKTIVACGNQKNPLLFEHNNTVILADQLSLNLADKTGAAENIRIHVYDGYILAGHASKKNDNEWVMRDISYTSCDRDTPHWCIRAARAQVHGGYFLTVSGISFRIGTLPIFWVPYLAIPLQGQSHSGFLIPRFFIDYQYGFGFKQEYYHAFSPHSDTTLAFDWRDRRGIVVSDEFRWARSITDYTHINAHCAIVRDMLVLKGDKLLKRTRHRYWIKGVDFAQHPLNENVNLYRLISLDLGTDKRLGYHFFNKICDIENTFNSALINRFSFKEGAFEIDFDSHVTKQKIFEDKKIDTDMNIQILREGDNSNVVIKQECESDVTVSHIPHCEFNSSYIPIGQLCSFRWNFFIDLISYRKRFAQRFFHEKALVAELDVASLEKNDVVRSELITSFFKTLCFGSQTFSIVLSPRIQMRSCQLERGGIKRKFPVYEENFLNKGSYRLLTTSHFEWGMPEFEYSTDTWCWFLLPTLRWDYCPSFNQDHWFFADRRDRIYGENAIKASILTSFQASDLLLDFYCEQGYDFSPPEQQFLLERSGSFHFLPLRCDFNARIGDASFLSNIEYNIKNGHLISAQVKCALHHRGIDLSFGYLFYSPSMLRTRELLSTLPHFINIDCSIPVSDRVRIHYHAQFYSHLQNHFLQVSRLIPLLHSVGVEYRGHCWGIYLGFEEKKYKEYGHDKTDRVIMFSVKFDSLGSFAKKIKNYNIFKTK